MSSIDVLHASGHLTLEWDPDKPVEIANARAEVARLRDAGYSFFLADNEPADAVAAGQGKLVVQRIDGDVVDALSEADFIETDLVETGQPSPKKRGRPRGVAVRPMAGG